jgi:release factor glutamine methyltransferase
MNLGEYRHHFKSRLEGKYPEEEVTSFFNWLSESFLNLKRAEIPLELKRSFTEEEQSLFDNALGKLEKEVPIQYVLGETEFYGMKFNVSPGVLIPRPETEELVDLIIKETRNSEISIIDIGTGSGCIAISLARHLPKACVTALDVSDVALQIAQTNAELNQVEIEFIESDILKQVSLENDWDVIVSNPPYVLFSEKGKMHNNVLAHEPHSALFVPDNDPLLFYRKIAQLAHKHLTKNGKLYFEINEVLGDETVEMLKLSGFEDVNLFKDVFGKNRMVSAAKPLNPFFYKNHGGEVQ